MEHMRLQLLYLILNVYLNAVLGYYPPVIPKQRCSGFILTQLFICAASYLAMSFLTYVKILTHMCAIHNATQKK